MTTFEKSRKSRKKTGSHGRGGTAGRRSARPIGAEFKVLAWLVRHPGWLLVPALGVWAAALWGVTAAGFGVSGLVAAVLAWWRAHPASFDRWAAPRIRSTWRRWTAYRGRRWRDVLDECDLTREHRRTGQLLVPRIVRVHSITPSVDVLTVRMVRGQETAMFTDRADALADALGAHQVAVSRARPGVVTIIVERRMPFEHVLDAPAIPDSVDEVDLTALDIGDDEFGRPFTLRIKGKPVLVVGGTGAGKSSFLWGPLRQMGPMIRNGLVRPWVIDLKGGVETDRGAPLFHRWATNMPDALKLLEEFATSMTDRQAWMRAAGLRDCPISYDTPYELLIIDELAMLTAYGDDPRAVREALRLLSVIMTQGRAAAHGLIAYVQEPTKDVVDVRDLFGVRICLGVAAASHVDMALGEGARDRGALADQIPGDPEHAGIGFVIDPVTRLPVRLRAGWTSDADVDELVQRCALTQDSADRDDAEVINLDRDQQHRDPDREQGQSRGRERRAYYTDDEDDEAGEETA
jgi:S-DNA-T family DNA segregation ATPase FtsK/SpoIIIE